MRDRHGLVGFTIGAAAMVIGALLLGAGPPGTRSLDPDALGSTGSRASTAATPTHAVGQATPAPSTPAGEVPVLLIPGWLDTARDLAALRIRLLAAGWPTDYVGTLTFADPVGSNREHAEELERAVDSLISVTGADQVDIVAHSMGGLATRWYLRGTPDVTVRRVVFIASPHRGTLSAHLAWGGGRDEMMPESAFLDSLNASAALPPDVLALTIRTQVDTHIVPGESATLPGVPDSLVCCPTHAGLLRDDTVFEIVLDFLDAPP